MAITTPARPGTSPGLIFSAPYDLRSATEQGGTLISDNAGNPVWFKPTPSNALENLDFKVQQLDGKPVLTTWQGTASGTPGYANLPLAAPEPGACHYIYDQNYHLIKTVSALDGWTGDLHELVITRSGTAVFTVFKPVAMDLSPYGGPADGFVSDFGVQEIDLHSGKLVFSWDALKHIDLADSNLAAATANSSDGNMWDAYHLNSIDIGPGGQLLISSRHTWAGYAVDRRTGDIQWQLGGRQQPNEKWPLIKAQGAAAFSWQHMLRFRSGNEISLFDDACCGANPDGSLIKPQGESHGMVLRVDAANRTATRVKTFFHAPPLLSASQGSAEQLANGNYLIGWGARPFYSEYTSAGNAQNDGQRNLLYAAGFPKSVTSYRVLRSPWVGHPADPPKMAVRASGAGQATVFASWNGSTQTTAWQVLAGPDPQSLRVIVPTATRTGFETAMPVSGGAPFFQVKALDRSGQVIGTSDVARL